MIPKRIYYAWFGPRPLPDKVKKNIAHWKKMNPDFEIKRINEDNFELNKYLFAKEAFQKKEWVFVVDVARLDIIYNNGGYYLDTDVELIRPLDDEFSKYNSIWALEDSDAINPGSMFGAVKHDKNLKNILDIYKNRSFSDNEDENISVPIISSYFLKHGFKVKNRKQYLDENKAIILPTDYFTPLHYWGGGHITKRTIGVHRFEGSWNDSSFSTIFRLKRQLMLLCPRTYYLIRHFRESMKKS